MSEYLLLTPYPCPKCNAPIYGRPYCKSCDWYDKEFDEWSKGQIKLLQKLYKEHLYTDYNVIREDIKQ